MVDIWLNIMMVNIMVNLLELTRNLSGGFLVTGTVE